MPAAAQTVLFSTGAGVDGRAIVSGPWSGQIDVRGGITQIATDDGGVVSFVGDASVALEDVALRVAQGKFTARAGRALMQISAPNGARVTLPAGGAASLGVAGGDLTGRALSGTLSIETSGVTRRFAAGDAFSATASRAVSVVTAGAQPVSSAPAVSDARPMAETENPLLPVFATGTPAQVLAQALGRRDAPLGFDFDAVSRATADVNLAYLRAGGTPGEFSAGLAGGTLEQYLTALRNGTSGAVPAGLANAYLGYFAADGLAGVNRQQQAIIDAYARVLAAGGNSAGFNDAAIGNAYSGYIQRLATGAADGGLSPQAVAAYENYVRSLGLSDTYDAGRRAQIAAFQQLQAAGGSPAASTGVDVIDRYLAYLATGGAAESFTGASSALIAAYLEYLRTVGLPAGVDPAAAERLLTFYAHLQAGGSIGTLPTTGGGTTPGPAEPVLPQARYAGRLYGFSGGQTFSNDLGLSDVGIDTEGHPRTFDGLTRIDTARLVEERQGDRWVIGRYTDGKVRTTFSSGPVEYTLSPNESIHFGYATSVAPVTRTSGTASYGLTASTTPSYFDGSAVTASALTAELAIAFGATPRFGIAGVLTTTAAGTAQRYEFESAGGLAAPSLAIRRDNDMLRLDNGSTPVTTTDRRCQDNCFLSPNLIASGADADVVAGTLGIYSARQRGQILTGAAVFTPGAAVVQPQPQPETQPITKATYAGAYLGRAGTAIVGGGDAGMVEIEVDAAGYPRGFRGAQRVGTARLVDAAKGDGWVTGRYTDGTFITTSQGLENTQTLSPTESLHFAFGTSVVPFTGNRGTARYQVASFTTPSYHDGSAVTDASLTGTIAVQFGTQLKYGIEALLTATAASQEQRYAIASTGGLTQPSMTGGVAATGFYLFGQAGVTSTDSRCADGCRFTPNMVGSGADGHVIAGTYTLSGAAAFLTGAAVFKQSARDLTPVVAPTPAPTGAPTGSVDLAGHGPFSSLNGSSVGTQAIAAADGRLEQIRQNKRGTNTDHEFGGLAGAIGWTRWSGGTTDSTFASGANTTLPENSGQHIVWGRSATNLPTTGTASYALAGATKPTSSDGAVAPGALTAGSLAVDFRAMKVGYDLSVQFGGDRYSVASRGGLAAPSVALLQDNRFDSSFRTGEGPLVNGNGCTGTNCFAEVRGFLAGAGGTHGGLVYHFLPGPSGREVSGAAAFTKNP
ncbi:hypothetical protein F1C10_14420 [Sphingomonas sp. NBWT7]|uniref:hypothetical protein n=1 Tax=Sphingomonas sp. NBWT7 TaxID=2596913 RepID=UPI0016293703|nr:hypothetical protein [Sphingomonas sp. NBWT7]QNE32996.1 hypothetical protein F1C10_14420 [Sphingomonas sp. NBWT7]